MTNEKLLERLNWRYATKKFDPSRKIAQATWETLEKTLQLSPSSFGLQPWTFLVIKDEQVRKQLREVSWDQPQITDASHLVVVAGIQKIDTEHVERYVARVGEVRAQSMDSLKGLHKMLTDFVDGAEAKGIDLEAWAGRQAYLALGVFLTSAAMLEVDACPMEGIDPAGYDRILGLEAKGLRVFCVVTAGYRASDDKYAVAPKVRFELESVVKRV